MDWDALCEAGRTVSNAGSGFHAISGEMGEVGLWFRSVGPDHEEEVVEIARWKVEKRVGYQRECSDIMA